MNHHYCLVTGRIWRGTTVLIIEHSTSLINGCIWHLVYSMSLGNKSILDGKDFCEKPRAVSGLVIYGLHATKCTEQVLARGRIRLLEL
jgi:hypothetical protein